MARSDQQNKTHHSLKAWIGRFRVPNLVSKHSAKSANISGESETVSDIREQGDSMRRGPRASHEEQRSLRLGADQTDSLRSNDSDLAHSHCR
jgi:hypothetical protein